jgi:diamine N-acetyltransferase
VVYHHFLITRNAPFSRIDDSFPSSQKPLGKSVNFTHLLGGNDMEPVYLRALEIGDLERTYKWHNDQQMYRVMGGVFHYVSRTSEEVWLREKQAYSPKEMSLAICLTEDSQHIGNIYLRNIDWISRHAEIQIWIGEPDQRSKGYGQAALRLLTKYALQDLALFRLYAFILEDNIPSLRMFEKYGWIVEAKLRKHAFIDGEFKNFIVMGLCADDN